MFEIDSLTTTNLLTILGWIIAFVFGLLSALIVQRRGRARKVLGWSLVSESDLLARDTMEQLAEGFRVPVKVLIRGQEETNLSTVRVRLANIGNTEVKGITVVFDWGSEATLHVGRYLGNLGIYRDKLKLLKDQGKASLVIAHINPAQAFEVEFLVSNYNSRAFTVEMAEPGVSFRQTDISSLSFSRSFAGSIALSLMGVRYDPVATQAARLVDEVQKLTAAIERSSTTR